MPIADTRFSDRRRAELANAGVDLARSTQMEYLKPLGMFILGVGFVIIYLFASGPHRDDSGETTSAAVLAGGYLVGLAIQLVFGVVGLWLAAKLWLGGVGPLGLALLRLAGIYALTDATGILLAPLLIIGLLINLAIYLGLIVALFDLEFVDACMLAVITFLLKFLAGFALAMMALQSGI